MTELGTYIKPEKVDEILRKLVRTGEPAKNLQESNKPKERAAAA